jgi:hypothetical protein
VQARKPQPTTPFKIIPRAMGLPAGQNYDNIGSLLEELEGPGHK